MIAMAKICKKSYPKHKMVFISPCHYKKMEAEKSEYVDYVLDYIQLKNLFQKNKIKVKKREVLFDKFYNDYTKIYPLAGGLGKTAHLNGILKENEIAVIDGIGKVMKWLNKPDKKVKFLDVNFCVGGCIGGPCTNSQLTIEQKKKKVLNYLKKAKKQDIPECKKGVVKKAEGIDFNSNLL
jgi:iron only hydrogenase large subunit-like protein